MRGQPSTTHMAPGQATLADVAHETAKLWRTHHLDYDQTKTVVERARRLLMRAPPRSAATPSTSRA